MCVGALYHILFKALNDKIDLLSILDWVIRCCLMERYLSY